MDGHVVAVRVLGGSIDQMELSQTRQPRRQDMVRNFKSEDKGKSVVTADGDMVGRVDQASGSSAHVKPDQNLSRSIRRRLGWTEEGEETYRLQKSKVDRITDDEIHLKKNL